VTTSLKGFVDDDERAERIVGSRASSPGSRLRSMLLDAGLVTEAEQQPAVVGPADDGAESATARRLSYAVQPASVDLLVADESSASVVPAATPALTPMPSLPSVVPALEATTTPAAVVSRATLDSDVAATPAAEFVTALSLPDKQRAVELPGVHPSLSSRSAAQ